jgi:hypothetical protein
MTDRTRPELLTLAELIRRAMADRFARVTGYATTPDPHHTPAPDARRRDRASTN